MEIFRSIDIDLEYRKYMVLAKVSAAEKALQEKRIYPEYLELKKEYSLLESLLGNIRAFMDDMPKYIESVSLQEQKMVKKAKEKGEGWIEDIAGFADKALNYIKPKLKEAEELKETFYQEINISDIGVCVNYKNEGYLFVRNEKDKKIEVYRYKWNVLPGEDEPAEEHFVKVLEKPLSKMTNLADVKLEVIKQNPDFPVPQTYWVESEEPLPIKPTLLPLSRQKIIDASF
ncbi:MAG: hypothetical protein D6707_05020 [Bacteroidetes bacterium]|nr:MAG: hypothetical protein D6707_05020 [Bacteroidota bacterium]